MMSIRDIRFVLGVFLPEMDNRLEVLLLLEISASVLEQNLLKELRIRANLFLSSENLIWGTFIIGLRLIIIMSLKKFFASCGGGKVPNIYPRGDRREFDNSFIKKAAFTLVEVLIVIGVIGIVAALTIPNLLQKYTERQNIIKLQRVYALLQQATRSMVAEHGELHTWADDSRVFFENEFMKRVKVIDKNTTYNEIVSSSGLGWDNLIPTLELLDGTVVRIRSRIKNDPAGSYHTCNTSVNHASSGYSIHYGSCAYIRVDINGKGKPNKAGQDIFEFRVYTDGVLPKGIAKSGSNDSFKECYSGTNDNLNCTAWVIENKNMDYLRCRDDLSWTENRSCPKK